MTEAEFAARMVEALDVAKRLPGPRSLQPGNIFRYLVVSKDSDDVDEVEHRLSRLPPSAAEIAAFDEVIDWIGPLPVRIRKLLWLRADANSWRFIAREMGLNPRYCQRLWRSWAATVCSHHAGIATRAPGASDDLPLPTYASLLQKSEL